jgi:hypothetical protein
MKGAHMSGIISLLKTFGLDPDQMMKTVEEFKGLVLGLTTALRQVEANQRAIMAHLGVEQNGHVGHSSSVEHSGSEASGRGERNEVRTIANGAVNGGERSAN